MNAHRFTLLSVMALGPLVLPATAQADGMAMPGMHMPADDMPGMASPRPASPHAAHARPAMPRPEQTLPAHQHSAIQHKKLDAPAISTPHVMPMAMPMGMPAAPPEPAVPLGPSLPTAAAGHKGKHQPPVQYIGGMPPMMDDPIHAHFLLEQLEDRWHGNRHDFHFSGQGWVGTDENRLWLRSEGGVAGRGGAFSDGQTDLLYSRAISTYFDLQAGARLDLDDQKGRGWGAFGIQGLAPYFFETRAMGYVSDRGHLAAQFEGSYDLRLTQRLVLQPQAEINLYSKADPGRNIGGGLATLDTGLRLRYEISRKFAPYIGVTYSENFAGTRRRSLAEGEKPTGAAFTLGVRLWF